MQLPSHNGHANRVFVQSLVIASEGKDAREKHVEQHTEAPHVSHDCVAMAFEEDLGGAEEQRTVALRASFISQKELGEPKVHNHWFVDGAADHDLRLHYYVF